MAEPVIIDGKTYRLVDSARYCYLPFMPVYQAHLFREKDGAENMQTCLKLDYMRNISAQTLSRATRDAFNERHGEAVTNEYAAMLAEVGAAYRDASEDSSYLYCMTDVEGVLSRDASEVLRFTDAEFAQRFMQIWVENPKDDQPEWQFRDCS